MPEKVVPGPVSDERRIREAVCIHTKKIFDSCKDKDCIEDLRVYPTRGCQEVIDRAVSVKAGCAELLYAYIDVEPVTFNRGFYTVDVRYFYPSINHAILKAKFRKLFKDAELLWLLDEIIDSISTASIEDMRNIWLLDEDIDPETGIPIGNYLSQYCGNFYLSSFDHWLKEKMHVKHAFRYMDDIVIFGSSKEALHKLQKEVKRYFKTELHLTVKGNWQIFPTYVRGLDFVGYRSFLNFTLLRKSSCKSFKQKMNSIRKKTENGQMMRYSEWCSINSYKGWLKHCDSYRLQAKYIAPVQADADRYYQEVIQRKAA